MGGRRRKWLRGGMVPPLCQSSSQRTGGGRSLVLGSSTPFFPAGGIGGLGGGFFWLNSLAQEPAVGVGDQGKQGVSWKLHGETVTQSLAASDPLSPAVCSPSSGQEVFPTISCTERMGRGCCQRGPTRFLLLCVMEPPLVLWLVLCPVLPPEAVNSYAFSSHPP